MSIPRSDSSAKPFSLRSWAQLVRVPNTLTAPADVLAGFVMVAASLGELAIAFPLVLMSAASICMYWAGMVLNDVFDVEVDRKQLRGGPLVDGRISLALATQLGWSLLGAGVLLSGLSVAVLPRAQAEHGPIWLPVFIAVLLAATVLAYDGWFKRTALAPLLMGLCRGLNMGLGVSLGACLILPAIPVWYVIGIVLLGHVLFVTGLTVAARKEALDEQSRPRLVGGWGLSALGLILIAGSTLIEIERPLRLSPTQVYPLLILLLSFPWLRRAFMSIVDPCPGTVGPAIRQAILGIIFYDAAIALQFGGDISGLIVCSFAIPTLLLGQIFRMT